GFPFAGITQSSNVLPESICGRLAAIKTTPLLGLTNTRPLDGFPVSPNVTSRVAGSFRIESARSSLAVSPGPRPEIPIRMRATLIIAVIAHGSIAPSDQAFGFGCTAACTRRRRWRGGWTSFTAPDIAVTVDMALATPGTQTGHCRA